MARPTQAQPRGFSPDEVDLMDISVCAVLMGVGADQVAADRGDFMDAMRRQAAGEDVSSFFEATVDPAQVPVRGSR